MPTRTGQADYQADYIVIGAGPAGCAVAARLAQSAEMPSVALFETGPAKAPVLSNVPIGIAAIVPVKSAYNYAYKTVPQAGLNGRRGFQPRGRGVGGSSLINAMVYMRGQPQDYDSWAALGCTGWAWNDVLPYFIRGEDNARGADRWHGVGGPLHVSDLKEKNPVTLAFVEAAVAAGYERNPDFNGASQEGVGLYQVFQKDGRRYNAARGYLEAAAPMPNLMLHADTQVRRILFAGRRAIGIACGRRGHEQTFYAGREIIVCAGAFGSPQLLMLSGIGPKRHLEEHGISVIHDAPEVGANLQDHCDYVINVYAKGEGLFGMTPAVAAELIAGISRYRTEGRGMLTTNAAEAGGFVRSGPEVERPDIQFHFCIGFVDDHNRKLHFGTGMGLHICGLRPKSRGEVRLASAEPADAPEIDPNYLSAPEDLETLVRGVEVGQKILAQPPLAKLWSRGLYGTGRDDPDRLRELIRAHADTIYHPVGTCRMGGDERSVVDAELRVRGVDRLRVADASIMPTLISGNTQAPTAMIGEKAADLILGRQTAG